MGIFIDKIAWLHIVDGRLLCARSHGKDIYYLPGGKRDPGESDHETLIREIAEELSVRIQPDTITFWGVFEAAAHGKAAGTPIRMTCYTADYVGTLSPSAEIEELAWFTSKDLDRVSPICRDIIEQLHGMKLLL